MVSLSLCLAHLEPGADEDAFTAFFDRYHRLVLHKANSIVKNRETAEDITQEVFLYAAEHFEAIRRGREERQVAHYLLLCTASRAIDHLRGEKRREGVAVEDVEDVGVCAEDVEQLVLRREAAAKMREVVAALPETYCAALALRLDGAPYEEIAAMLNISKDAAYKRVQRGCKLVRERMAEENDI
jgi:RNA polymerase sigma-70 factor (ECF subfamily)